MAISTDASIVFWGTQDQIDDGTTATVASNAYSEASSEWTNDDDARFANFVLECQFDTTMPTVGSIGLFARPLNIQGTNDPEVPSDNNPDTQIGTFRIPFGVAADNNFFAYVYGAELPGFQASQIYEFYFKNTATGQTIGVDWNLWVTPMVDGPRA